MTNVSINISSVISQRMAGVTYIIGFLLLGGAAARTVDIVPDITVHMNQIISVPFSIHNISNNNMVQILHISTDENIAKQSFRMTSNETFINGILNITGVFLGRTKLTFTLLEERGVSAKWTVNFAALLFSKKRFLFCFRIIFQKAAWQWLVLL